MEGKLLDNLTNVFELDLPEKLETMDQYIDFIVPKIQQWSEDLKEEKFYVGKRWKELRDSDTYHETVLNIFMPGNVYLVSVDGDITRGIWQYMADTNAFIFEYANKSELYDLVFLNTDFLILKKSGDQVRKGKAQYRVYADEAMMNKHAADNKKELTWRAAMEELYNVYRSNSRFVLYVMGLVALIIFFVVFQYT